VFLFLQEQEEKMKTRIVVLIVLTIALIGCSATAISTATPTATQTFTPTITLTFKPTLTLTPTPTLTLTPTATPTPTPKPFPASLDDFIEEVDNNCAKPPEEEMTQFEIDGWYKPFSPMTLDRPDFALNIYYMALFLKEKIGKTDMEVKFMISNGLPREDNWWCLGYVLSSLTNGFSIDNPEEFQEFENQWGNWSFPVTLFYWSPNGFVIYEYEPPNTPAP